jgi:tetratricopeptide (TPR) repeat protein
MGVDARHDHSFGLPRPDLTERFGTPNACTGCHEKEGAAWATAAVKQWYGRLRPDRAPWTAAFAAARARRPEAHDLLLQLASDRTQPGIVRATALHELPEPHDRASHAALVAALGEADPMLRWTAAAALAEGTAAPHEALRTLLQDPVRAVRMAAARGLATAPTGDWPAAEVAARDAALAEYVTAQQVNADRPEARMNLGNLLRDQGRVVEAEAEFRAALRLHPQFVAAYVNLADLHREAGRETDCERTLRDGLSKVPGSGDLMHALGLALVRQRRLDEAVPQFDAAVRAGPEQARFAYVYAVALESMGRMEPALAALEAAIARLPADSDLRELQVEFLAKHGDLPRARAAALDYLGRWPDSAAAARWRATLLR